jgi:hypothetical protein
MKRQSPATCSRPAVNHRSGVSLSEVLISMLIMSVGVVSLAALFPISVLRSIQASQLTSSTLLFRNAQSRLQFDNTLLVNSVTGVPTMNTIQKNIIDPFGVLAPTLLGNIGGIPRIRAVVSTGTLAGDRIAAENLAMLPDSWGTVREDTVTAFSPTDITLSAAASNFSEIVPRIASSSFGTSLPPLYRVTIFDAAGKLAQRRTIRQVSNSTLSWQDPSGTTEAALPAGFIPAKCRVEVRDNRYTWLMTVRKRALDTSGNTWTAEVDLVTFFNRSINPNDEQQFAVELNTTGGFDQKPGLIGFDDDNDGNIDSLSEQGASGSDDNRTLHYIDAPAFPPPLLKKGGYLLEPTAGRWYRIVGINTISKTILVDKDLYNKSQLTSIVLMKNIIQVYEFGNVTGSL